MPCLPLTPKVYEVLLFVRSGEGIADLIETRNVARFRVTDEGIDAVPLRGPMAVEPPATRGARLRPRTWRFYKDGALTDTVESTGR